MEILLAMDITNTRSVTIEYTQITKEYMCGQYASYT